MKRDWEVKQWKSDNLHWKDYTLKKMEANVFMKHLGIQFILIDEGFIKAEMPFQNFMQQQNGFLNGGLSATLCDVAAGFAAYSLVAEGQQVFTVECKTSFYSPGKAPLFYAEGWVTKKGSRFHFCESEVYYLVENEKIIVAKCSTTMAVV